MSECGECGRVTYRWVDGLPLCEPCDRLANPAYFAQAERELAEQMERNGAL